MNLASGNIFPATFNWNNFEDMSSQIKNVVLKSRKQNLNFQSKNQNIKDNSDTSITSKSTFKPKPLGKPTKTFVVPDKIKQEKN